jgi:hypothetical protein
MAGASLTAEQRVLWKLYDQHGGVDFMSDEQLEDWMLACRTVMDNAAATPKSARQARALWALRLAEAGAALDQRGADAG